MTIIDAEVNLTTFRRAWPATIAMVRLRVVHSTTVPGQRVLRRLVIEETKWQGDDELSQTGPSGKVGPWGCTTVLWLDWSCLCGRRSELETGIDNQSCGKVRDDLNNYHL